MLWYGKSPGTVNPPRSYDAPQKRPGQLTSCVYLPPKVPIPESWIPNRYGRSEIPLTTRRCFSSPFNALLPADDPCLGMLLAVGNSKRSPRLSIPCTERLAKVYARPAPHPMLDAEARLYGRSICTCRASYQVLPSFVE